MFSCSVEVGVVPERCHRGGEARGDRLGAGMDAAVDHAAAGDVDGAERGRVVAKTSPSTAG